VSDQNSQLTESQIEKIRDEFHAHIASLPIYGPEPHWISFDGSGRYFYVGIRALWLGWLAHAESIQARLELLEKVADAAKEWRHCDPNDGDIAENILNPLSEAVDALAALDSLEVGK